MADSAQIRVNLFDGTREPMPQDTGWMVRLSDGRPLSERQTFTFADLSGPSKLFTVPFFDNFFDNYTLVVSPDSHGDSGWFPVTVHPAVPAVVDILALSKDAAPHFANATWKKLEAARPGWAEIILRGCSDAASAEIAYGLVLENRPKALACFLNITAALSDMVLPSGKRPLEYYWNIAWPFDPSSADWLARLDQVFKQDRFFCYVEARILTDVRAAAALGSFAQEMNPGALHSGATESYKQTQFDVANAQLTFHGGDIAVFAGPDGKPVDCIKIEPDIDYFKDLINHGLKEVFPNALSQTLTDPGVVYMLRWMAGQKAGLTSFDPLYTVDAEAIATSAARR